MHLYSLFWRGFAGTGVLDFFHIFRGPADPLRGPYSSEVLPYQSLTTSTEVQSDREVVATEFTVLTSRGTGEVGIYVKETCGTAWSLVMVARRRCTMLLLQKSFCSR